jgi:hypothetical protein
MRRRYISLSSVIVFVVCLILKHLIPVDSGTTPTPNDYLSEYYEYALLIFQIVLMRIVFMSKNNDTKNIVTGMTVVITIVFMVIFFYSLIS